VSGRIFSDNNNYLVNGAQTLSQRPILRLEEHISRNVADALWLSADAYYNLGGETSIDGVEQDNMANSAEDRRRHGTPSLARCRSRAELRARRRQTCERALFANRAIYLEATLVGGFCSVRRQNGKPASSCADRSQHGSGAVAPGAATPSAEDRFLAHTARSFDEPRRAAQGRLCSLMGQGERLFRLPTPWDACVLCALAGA
jgi:hypothetical protein